MNLFAPKAFFDLSDKIASPLFDELNYVWDAMSILPNYIEQTMRPEILGTIEDGAWVEPGGVQLGTGSIVQRGAIVRAPAIIGDNTVIRSGANLRGHVIIGDHCTVGAEMRQTMMLSHSSARHSNSCIFTSLIGSRVNFAGSSNVANTTLDGSEVVIRIKHEKQRFVFPTNQSQFGAVIGDDTQIGAFCLLQPGAIIGRNCLIYPQAAIRGYVPHNSKVVPKKVSYRIMSRNGSVAKS